MIRLGFLNAFCAYLAQVAEDIRFILCRLADSGFLKNFLYQGGVMPTVSWVFEDIKFKTAETANWAQSGKHQFWSEPSERSIFQTFWKVHCWSKSLFFELETSNFGYLLIFSFY